MKMDTVTPYQPGFWPGFLLGDCCLADSVIVEYVYIFHGVALHFRQFPNKFNCYN